MLRNNIQVNEERPVFQLFFLKDDEDQSVDVEEVEKVDFKEVKERLEQGESVFITRKGKQKLNRSLVAREDAAKPLFFTHL